MGSAQLFGNAGTPHASRSQFSSFKSHELNLMADLVERFAKLREKREIGARWQASLALALHYARKFGVDSIALHRYSHEERSLRRVQLKGKGNGVLREDAPAPEWDAFKRANGPVSIEHENGRNSYINLKPKGEGSVGVLVLTKREGELSEEAARFFTALSKYITLAINSAGGAYTDPLTGLHNKRYLEGAAATEIRRSVRQKLALSAVMLDLDNFKGVNDTYGHPAGDAVLRHLGKLLRKSVREGIDTAARYGGEEFVLILPGTSLEGSLVLAERIRKEVERVDWLALLRKAGIDAPVPLKITISAGSHEFDLLGIDPAELGKKDRLASELAKLLKAADDKLYDAKKAGRNRVMPEAGHQTATS